MGGASVAVCVAAPPEGNAATFCFPGTRACAATMRRWLPRMTEMCGRSAGGADDAGADGGRAFTGGSKDLGIPSETAGGFSGIAIGGASATTFGDAEGKPGVTGGAHRVGDAGAAACEVTSALRCSRCTSGASDCVGRDSNTARSEGLKGDVGLSVVGV